MQFNFDATMWVVWTNTEFATVRFLSLGAFYFYTVKLLNHKNVAVYF